MDKVLLVAPAVAVAITGVFGLTMLRPGKTAVAGPASGPHVTAATPEEAGRYLVLMGGCNDCHTPGWAESGGKLPQDQWLLGSPVGYSGPWGTTYPANLRLTMSRMSEDQWVKFSHIWEGRPPMPYWALRDMSEPDLRAMYRFVRSLGPAGEPAPTYLPPGQTPATPYHDLSLQNAPAEAAAH